MKGELRLFVAVKLGQEAREALRQLVARAQSRQAAECIRWVDPDKMHITLRFLGQVKEGLVPGIASALHAACAGRQPFELRLGGLGSFPSEAAPRVIWVGLAPEGMAELESLQKAVNEALHKIMGTPEDREFRPHITVGRVRDKVSQKERQAIRSLLAAMAPVPRASFVVDAASLMRSTLLPTGPQYECLYQARFCPER